MTRPRDNSSRARHHHPGARGLLCASCGEAAFCVAGKQGGVARCQRCFNHFRRYHLTGTCTMTRWLGSVTRVMATPEVL